jgi:hypothetical protein
MLSSTIIRSLKERIVEFRKEHPEVRLSDPDLPAKLGEFRQRPHVSDDDVRMVAELMKLEVYEKAAKLPKERDKDVFKDILAQNLKDEEINDDLWMKKA